MDELSCKTHRAVMRSVFNLPPASEGVQRAFHDTDRSAREMQEKQGRNVMKHNFCDISALGYTAGRVREQSPGGFR